MTTEELLVAFPNLRRLNDLIEVGWSFEHHWDDGQVEVVRITGKRFWSRSIVDALRIKSATDAAGVRLRPGGEVWRREGTLADVVDGLFSLPAPEAPSAPRLVKASHSLLWTPRSARP